MKERKLRPCTFAVRGQRSRSHRCSPSVYTVLLLTSVYIRRSVFVPLFFPPCSPVLYFPLPSAFLIFIEDVGRDYKQRTRKNTLQVVERAETEKEPYSLTK